MIEEQRLSCRFLADGFNPNYSCISELDNIIEKQLPIKEYKEISAVFYYGTGCGLQQNCDLVANVLKNHFINAEIHVTHDMMAAAHATLGNKNGIACILGTGSNSCVYDGRDIIEKGVSLGYLVGDEGSGCQIGKELIKAYFYGSMPKELRNAFEADYNLTINEFIEQAYHGEHPSRYLASFAKFAGKHQQHPFVRVLCKKCFNDFIDTFICRFAEYQSMTISFVGSVAFYFQEILKECFEERHLHLGEVMAAPAEGLIKYHLNR